MPRRITPYGEAEVLAIRVRYATEGPARLAAEFGRSPDAVAAKARHMGLRAGPYKDHVADMQAGRAAVNTRYFETWSPNMAYLLGYIWADGSVQLKSVRFKCKSDDEELLFAIRDELGSAHAVRREPGRRSFGNYQGKPQTRLTVTSRDLARSLRERHGVLPNKKRLNLSFPDVPDQFLAHFARGNLDGDGHIRAAHGGIHFLSSPRFAAGLQKRLCEVAGLRPGALVDPTGNGKLAAFGWDGRTEILYLRSFLYPPGQYLFLQRKRAVLDNALLRPIRPLGHFPEEITAVNLLALYKEHGTWQAVQAVLGVSKPCLRFHRRKLGLGHRHHPAHWPEVGQLLDSYKRHGCWAGVAEELSMHPNTLRNVRLKLGLG